MKSSVTTILKLSALVIRFLAIFLGIFSVVSAGLPLFVYGKLDNYPTFIFGILLLIPFGQIKNSLYLHIYTYSLIVSSFFSVIKHWLSLSPSPYFHWGD